MPGRPAPIRLRGGRLAAPGHDEATAYVLTYWDAGWRLWYEATVTGLETLRSQAAALRAAGFVSFRAVDPRGTVALYNYHEGPVGSDPRLAERAGPDVG